MEVTLWTALCAFFICFTSAVADPQCVSCRGAGGPFKQGHVHKYKLDGLSVTKLPGSPDDVSSLAVSASAEVYAESNCQYVLRLSNVDVKTADGKTYNGLNEACAKPVKFSYVDGKLGGLCTQAGDDGAALNIKRAVISLLSSAKQQSVGSESATENDVFGICPTDFTFSKAGSKLTIQKTRNLNRCALREEFNFPFPTSPYQAIQSSFGAFETSPLFVGELKVTQEIENGVLRVVTGEENYKYTPLLNQESRATVKVTYKLTLEGASPGQIAANVNSHKAVFFEVPHASDGLNNHDKIHAALQKATAALDPVATPAAAKEFSNLVNVLEQGSKADILQVYNAAEGTTAKNLFLDGLLYAGSADSVEAAAELLKSGQISSEAAVLWYLDLNFVKHVSRGSLASVLPLLSGSNVPYQAYLGIGSLAGKFYLEHGHDAAEFKQLVSQLAVPLDGGCKVDSHEKENYVIASLKGLRNTRNLPQDVAQKVIQCASDKSIKTRVRVAAVEAFFADASKPELQQAAVALLKDVEEDSELRIKAYLALVEHPCPKTADILKELIDNEPIHQVGSFIVSHLRNLRASVSPEKEVAKKMFGNIISKKKYPIDDRKFSKNYEVSYSLDALNLGAVGEANRIFSQKSFIPRSVSLNLTTQIFGHSVNLAEVGLRAENVERILEKYLGPKGILKSQGAKLLDNAVDQTEEAVKKAKESAEQARPKRSISKQDTESAASKIKLGPDYHDQDVDLDLSLKLFGFDVAWYNYHHKPLNYEDLKRKYSGKLDEAADKAKGLDINYKKASRFLDAGVTYPIGLGLPLKLKISTNTAVNVKLSGQLDVKAMLNNPKNTHIALQVVPSASLEIESQLLLDADVVESGLKVTANIHTSTGTDLTVKVLDGYGVDVKLGLPVNKQEIINFHTDIVSIVKEKRSDTVESPIKFNIKRLDHGGCFDQLNTLLGLTICGQVNLPAEGLTSAAYGPSKASLYLEKGDPSLTGYHFKAYYNNKEPDQVSVEVLLDTPNSKTNRKFSLIAVAKNKPQRQISVTLVSPFKQASFEAFVIDNEREQAVSAKLLSDGTEYSFKAGARVSQEGSRKKYEPLLEYKYPEATKSDRAWNVGRKGIKSTKQAPQTTVGISGAVYVETNPATNYRKYELKSVALSTPKGKATVDGTIIIDNKHVDTDLKASFDKETFKFHTSVQQLADHKFSAKVEFLPSQHPDMGGSVHWEYEKTSNQIQNKLVIVHGSDFQSESARISINQLVKFKYESAKDFEFYTDNSVTYPVLAVNAGFKGGVTPKSFKYDIHFSYDKTQVSSKLDANVGVKSPYDYSLTFEGKALGNSVSLTSKHEHLSTSKSKFTNALELTPGGKYSLIGEVDLGSKQGEVYKSLSAELKMPQEPKNVKVTGEFKQNSKVSELKFEIIAGSNAIVDVQFKLTKLPEPSGSFKVLLHKILNGHGTFQTSGGKSSGSFQVVTLKTGREIHGNGELSKTDKTVSGFAELLFDAKKDPSKKIRLQTDTRIVGQSVDSKNKIHLLNENAEFNVKGSLDGTLSDGTLIGDVEVVLPSGRIVAGKVNRVFQLSPADKHVEGTWELLYYQAREAQPKKWVLKVAGKNINIAKAQFDGLADFSYVSPANEDVHLHVAGKKLPSGNNWAVAAEGGLSGSLLKHSLSTKLGGEVSDQFLKGQLTPDHKLPPAHYDFELKVDNEVVVHSAGKVNLDHFNNELELKVPEFVKSQNPELPITSLKWHTACSVSLFAPDNQEFKISSSDSLFWNGDKFVKLNVDVHHKDVQTQGKVTLESHAVSSHTLKFKLYNDVKSEKGEVELGLQWEGKEADLNVKVDGYSINPTKAQISSNIPGYGKYLADIYSKVSPDGNTGEVTVSGSANEQKFTYSLKYSHSESMRFVDIVLETPQGANKLYSKYLKKGENHGAVESKVLLNSFTLEMNGEANLHSLNDIFIKLYIDSPQLKINKLDFEAKSELSKSSAHRIAFHGKSNGKEITGSLAIASKGTAPNIHYVGSGAVNVGETSYPVEFTFKNDRQDQSKGYHYDSIFDVKVGKHAISAKTILQDDGTVFKLERTDKYCYENDCKNDDYKIINERKGASDFNMAVDVTLGLFASQVALVHPLVIKGSSKKDGWQYDENIELAYGPNKLNYRDYLSDERAGFELTLPKRTIAGELLYNVKKPSLKVEANFWLDKKNSADKKTSLLIDANVNETPEVSSAQGEARFNSPGLKELSISGNTIVNKRDKVVTSKYIADVFAQENQKLIVDYKYNWKTDPEGLSLSETLHVHSKGLNVDSKTEHQLSYKHKTSFGYSLNSYYVDSNQNKRNTVAELKVDHRTYKALIKIPESTLYSADVTFEKGNKDYQAKGKLQFFNLHFEQIVEVQGTNLKVTAIQKKDGGNQQLDINAGFAFGQVAEINAKFNKKPLVSLEIALDETHFLKSKHSYNTDNIKDYVKLHKDNYVALAKEASRVLKESGAKFSNEVTDKVDDVRKALVNCKPAIQYYQNELEQIKNDISSNKDVKDAIDYFNKTFGTIVKQIGVILQDIANTVERLTTILNDTLKKITESVKAVIPKLKALYEEASTIIIHQVEAALDFATSLVNDLLDKIKEHEKDIQEITSVFTDFVHDVGQLFAKAFSEVQREVKDFVTVLWDQIQALPAYTIIKEKIEEIKNFKIPDEFWVNYHEVVAAIEAVLPTPELKHLFKYAAEIFEKVVKNQPINTPEVLQQLYKELVAAIRSAISFLEAQRAAQTGKLHNTDIALSAPTFGFYVAPPGTFRFSLLNWIRSPDLPSFGDVLHTYMPQYYPPEFIPPFSAHALLVGGTEFFTFDKKHYSFKGSCSYILTKDMIDGNFTVVANLEGGKLKSIAVFDHKNSVELQHDNKVLLNNQPSDLPVHYGELHLWSKYDQGTAFASESGLMFFCTPHLKMCAFVIDGYYFGKTRGLLGTYNNEPYDDSVVPDGKTAKSTSEFTNSWKVSPQCAAGAVQDQPAPQAPECTKLFSGDSSLRGCFPLQNPDNFREACNKAVAGASGAEKQDKACNVALSYAGSCFYVHLTKVSVPDYCGSCQVGSQKIAVGDSVSVKSPQKQADVVFVVEQILENEEVFKDLITPLVTTLTNELKSHGVTDVHFGLIGYGAQDQHWPSLYTFDGKYSGFKGTSKNIYFSKVDNVTEPKLSDRLKDLQKQFKVEIGTSKRSMAFKEAVDYPFRPEAAKTIISVQSSECTNAILPLQTLRVLYGMIHLQSSGIGVNLVTPLEDLEVEGKDDKVAANIVGFDSELVYTQSESKNKVLKGNEDEYSHLKYKSDPCIELALGAKGTVFSSSNFVKGKPSLRKNFLQVLSRKVTESLTNEELRQECKCELDKGLLSKTKCKVVGKKEKEAIVVKGGVKGVKT